jgi:hypothetical protein
MATYSQIVVAAPQSAVGWMNYVGLKTPQKDEKLGYVDPIKRGTTFRAVAASDAPLLLKQVRTPFDCFSVDDCTNKGRGKLTIRVQLNPDLWNALNGLDKLFADFLVEHRAKLFSASDAAHIGRDASAINLKMKSLAPRNIDGSPELDGYITVRINGRGSEIDALVVKDGPSGRYVSEVKWAARTSPLTSNSTRISIVTGISEDGKPIVRDTLPINGVVPVGSQRVRYVGPGDISAKGAVLRYALFRPAYWSIAPGGGASISLVFDTIVVQNFNDESNSSEAAVAQASGVPEGFQAYDDAAGAAGVASVAADPCAVSSGGGFHVTSLNEKRRRLETVSEELPTPVPAAAALVAPGAPRRFPTGGLAPSSLTLTRSAAELVHEQEVYEERIREEHHDFKRRNAISAAGGGRGGFGEETQAYVLPDESDE